MMSNKNKSAPPAPPVVAPGEREFPPRLFTVDGGLSKFGLASGHEFRPAYFRGGTGHTEYLSLAEHNVATARLEFEVRSAQEAYALYLKEAAGLRAELTRERALRRELVEALEFYADKENWGNIFCDGDVRTDINGDSEMFNYGTESVFHLGGKRAREALSKHNDALAIGKEQNEQD